MTKNNQEVLKEKLRRYALNDICSKGLQCYVALTEKMRTVIDGCDGQNIKLVIGSLHDTEFAGYTDEPEGMADYTEHRYFAGGLTRIAWVQSVVFSKEHCEMILEVTEEAIADYKAMESIANILIELDMDNSQSPREQQS